MRNYICALLTGAAVLSMASAAQAGVIYDSLYTPMPSNVVSMPYQAQQNTEFGDEIQFAGTSRALSAVTLTLSDWAMYSTYAADPAYNSTGWTWPLTLTLYNVGAGNTLGSVIASQTVSPTILWRPAPDGCDAGNGFTGADGQCDHGLAQNVSFDFTGTTVPNQIVYGLSFNTQTYGPNPTGVAGPYNSLNFGLNYVCTGSCAAAYGYWNSPTIGSQVDPHYLWFNNAGYDVTTGTANTFSQNYYSDPYYYVPAIRFNTVPEPASVTVFGAALVLLGFIEIRRQKKRTV